MQWKIASCITTLNQQELRREMGRRAQLAVQELTMVRNTQQSMAVIEKVLKKEARARHEGALA